MKLSWLKSAYRGQICFWGVRGDITPTWFLVCDRSSIVGLSIQGLLRQILRNSAMRFAKFHRLLRHPVSQWTVPTVAELLLQNKVVTFLYGMAVIRLCYDFWLGSFFCHSHFKLNEFVILDCENNLSISVKLAVKWDINRAVNAEE